MTTEIIEQTENPLFKRKELRILAKNKTTPSADEASKIVADLVSTDQENIKVKKIEGKFGVNHFIITANAYSSIEDKEQGERKTKQEIAAEKKGVEEKAKAEAEAAKIEAEPDKAEAEVAKIESEESKPEEAPKEEPKSEEKKEEVKQDDTKKDEN
jgi:ribosomal protein S24E